MDSGLHEQCVKTVRFLAVDAVEKAKSGHPGLPLGAAPLAFVLWDTHLSHNPEDPDWPNRDRFVLSAGHGSALLYSLLLLFGYDLTLEDLQQFRQHGSRTPGHPERGHTAGVEVTTGPLGQGLANAVGMAAAEAFYGSTFNRPDFALVDHYTYVVAGDGDLMEGVAAEAASLAGHLHLGKLICLYDDNRITLAGAAGLSSSEDVGARFRAYGWQVIEVGDGNDLEEISAAIDLAKATADQPTLIRVHTVIGCGAPHKQNTFEAHGSPLGQEEVRLMKLAAQWPVDKTFHIPPAVGEYFSRRKAQGVERQKQWEKLLREYCLQYPAEGEQWRQWRKRGVDAAGIAELPEFAADEKGIATRVVSGRVLQQLAERRPYLVGGSADLNPSTNTVLKRCGDFGHPNYPPQDGQGLCGGGWRYSGQNIHFGVREHAMGAFMNGLAAYGGLIPFGATFLVFADYLRPAIRLAALMKLRVIYLFTHDSIAVGEDGPTHQPVEQLAALRAIPDLIVIRPADANETIAAWEQALTLPAGPVALVLTRQAVPVLDRTCYAAAAGLARGAYVLKKADEPDLVLVASGSEVHLIVAAAAVLEGRGVAVQVVSMPTWELYERQSTAYKAAVFPLGVPCLAVEAGSTLGWHRYVGDAGDVMGIGRYGMSAPGNTVLAAYGFTVEHVVERALQLLQQKQMREGGGLG